MPKDLPLNTVDPKELAPFAHIKLIVSDLDGTLLDPDKNVIELIQKSIPRLRRIGVDFTIATGRALKGVSDILPELGLTASMPIALYNGSICIDAAKKKILYARVIPEDISRKVITWGLANQLPVLCYPQLSNSKNGFDEKPICFSPEDALELFSEPNGYQVKWQTYHSNDPLPDCLAILLDIRRNSPPSLSLLEKHLPEIEATQSGPFFIEIRPKGSNKGAAIHTIAQTRKVPMKSVLAIGDNDNDVEMLKTSGVSVAVGNASDNLLSVADYSTPMSSAKGCLQVIRLVLAAKRYRDVMA